MVAERTESSERGTREMPEKARRRTRDRQYRPWIVEEADRCTEPGPIGEHLRREGWHVSELGELSP